MLVSKLIYASKNGPYSKRLTRLDAMVEHVLA